MRALVASMLVAALVVAGSAAARADVDHAEALAKLQRGVDAFRAGDYASALPAFEAAQRLAPDKPNPYRWLALTQVQLGDCPSALGNIEQFLARVPSDEPRVPELIRLRTLCQQRALKVPPPREDAPPAQGIDLVSPAPRTPLTRRWWFWTAIAGATAVVATGVVWALADGDATTVLPPIQCGPESCQ